MIVECNAFDLDIYKCPSDINDTLFKIKFHLPHAFCIKASWIQRWGLASQARLGLQWILNTAKDED